MQAHGTEQAGGAPLSTAQPRDLSLWSRWLVTVTAAETLGFLVPASVGAALVDAPDTTMAPAIIAAGLVEGALLGAGQAAVARRARPGLPVVRFVALTAVAAAFAYAIALVPVVWGPRLTALPWPVVGLLGLSLAILLLGSIGTAQWWVLRGEVAGAAMWVPATAVAWAAGLLAFLGVATPLWEPGQPLGLTIAIGALAGLVMATVVAALTGAAFIRLRRRTRSQH
jgi:hypothetical protein